MSLVLQVNGSGAWKNVCDLEPEQLGQVMAGVGHIANVIGPRPTWRIVKMVDRYARVEMGDLEIRARTPLGDRVSSMQLVEALSKDDSDAVEHFAFCLRAFLQRYGQLSVVAFAQVGAELVEPKSPAQMVSDCKAAVLRIGLGLCSLPEEEYLRELEKLYTEGFQAGVTAANQVAK